MPWTGLQQADTFHERKSIQVKLLKTKIKNHNWLYIQYAWYTHNLKITVVINMQQFI